MGSQNNLGPHSLLIVEKGNNKKKDVVDVVVAVAAVVVSWLVGWSVGRLVGRLVVVVAVGCVCWLCLVLVCCSLFVFALFVV